MTEQPNTHNESINTGGSPYIKGNVHTDGGDFVGRDQNIQGDLVHGNKIVTIQQTLSEADLRDQANLRTLRQMVQKFWIEGVLEHSLNHEAAIRLHLADCSNLVENRPWKLLPQQPDDTERILPPDTHILDVFDQMNQRLLILGEPGAGKTTLLLELARALLKRADETPTYPSPVIFNLSSWIQRKSSLAEWLVDELRTRYSIPKKVAQTWVAQEKLLPLLDGLDEVQTEHRAACAQAINQFHEEHFVPLVVCSRMAEYETLTVRLKLQGAVLLQSLNTEQINIYLNRSGPSLAAVHSALQHDTDLQVLARSPLMLSIMALAYQNVASAELNLVNVTQTRRQHLFNAYIQRMFVRREVETLYSYTQTVHWLHWLASHLVRSGQTIFLIERMQPDWLQPIRQESSNMPLIILLGGTLYGLISGALWGLLFGLLGELSSGLLFGLLYGLLFGILITLIDGFSGRYKKINPIEEPSILRRKLKSSLYASLFWGLIYALIARLLRGQDTVLRAVVRAAMLFGLLGTFREIELAKQLSWSSRRIKSNIYFGLFGGLLFALIVGLLFPLINGLIDGQILGLLNTFTYALIVGLLAGILGGSLAGLIFQSFTEAEILITRNTQIPNQGVILSVRYSLTTGLIYGLLFALFVGLNNGLSSELRGLIGTLKLGLGGGMLGGLSGGLIGGGDVVVKHCFLRFILWLQGNIPWNYARFLDYATSLIFLRKVGGGYIFVHRLIMEHFASLTDEDIKRITDATQ